MKNLFAVFFPAFLLSHAGIFAQQPEPPRLLDFTSAVEGDGLRFKPVAPPLLQKAGARPAYWTYHWEFGDGSMSQEESPLHRYAATGNYDVLFAATPHYDDGKKPDKKKKPTQGPGNPSGWAAVDMPDVFDPKAKQAVAMRADSKPRAEEELQIIISYRNNSPVTTDGRLHLFFNEKSFPAAHFTFSEARAHFGETPDASYSQAPPPVASPGEWWTMLGTPRAAGGTNTSLSDELPPLGILEDMLKNNRAAYRDEHAWRFSNLEPGEKHNLFVTLAGTKNMLKDTSAFIHLKAVFAPFDPAIPPEQFIMEIEIVSSHDPNAIAVSDNRVNYRSVGSKKLDYKVQFQNNGEGPASTVEVKVEIPEGLDMARMRPVKWYPECPICPKPPTNRSCLDTASAKNSLTFTFRNIYLPGSRQKDVDDRDSTKGFVKYRIEADKDMPKLPFRSRAKITFDKNPPIYTNYTRTRFKIGISPGLKAGYHYDADLKSERYPFLGASLSPYKSWRLYPQLELLTGIKGRADLPDVVQRDSFIIRDTLDFQPGTPPIVRITAVYRDSLSRRKSGFFSVEIPLQVRKNFTRFFGLGIGGSARIKFENGEQSGRIRIIQNDFITSEPDFIKSDTTFREVQGSTYRTTSVSYTAFADFTFGAVRAGPNLGIRAGAILDPRRKPRPFVQVSVEVKL